MQSSGRFWFLAGCRPQEPSLDICSLPLVVKDKAFLELAASEQCGRPAPMMDGRVRCILLLALWLFASAAISAKAPVVLNLIKEQLPRQSRPTSRFRSLARRVDPLAIDLQYHLDAYYANVSIGTPPQTLRLVVDTNSADLLVLAPSSPVCTSSDNACAFAGTYDANASSTYDYYASNFSVTSGSGWSKGDYATEDVTVAGTTVQAMQFAIGYQGDLPGKIIPLLQCFCPIYTLSLPYIER